MRYSTFHIHIDDRGEKRRSLMLSSRLHSCSNGSQGGTEGDTKNMTGCSWVAPGGYMAEHGLDSLRVFWEVLRAANRCIDGGDVRGVNT
jgi:hypothetical protein